MKWIIIAWDQIRLNKKISIILVVFITMSIFLIGVISFYNNIFSYSQKQCEQVLTGTIDNIGLLYVENGDFYSQKAQDFINEAMDKKVVKFIGSISSLETDRFPELARLQGNEQGNLTWIWADQTVLGLCNLEFYKNITSNKVEIHYALIEYVNDKISDAWVLAKLLRYKNIPIKFLHYNAKKNNTIKASNKETYDMFKDILYGSTDGEFIGIETEFYTPPGLDIGASCGQFIPDYYLKYNMKEVQDN